MDALDRLAGVAADLLGRVDDTLAQTGAPDGHPIWPLLRQVRALPGDTVSAVAARDPAPLAEASTALRRTLEAYQHMGAALPDDTGWAGTGAQSFAAQWTALRTHLGAGPDHGLTGALAATLSYVDAIEQWVREGRAAVARTLATVLTSAEAVQVRVGGEHRAAAAAEIGVQVLACAAALCERGQWLLDEWRGRLAELPYVPPAPVAGGWAPTTIVPS